MKYHFRVHYEEEKVWAECLELEGCDTEGNSIEDLKENAASVLSLYLDEPVDSNVVLNLPKDSINGSDIIAIDVPIEQAFGIALRNYRQTHNFTQAVMAKKLDIKHIFGYQRLEKKSNPTLSLIKKIVNTFPDFPIMTVLE